MRARGRILFVLGIVLLPLLGVSSAAATSYVYATAWADQKLDEYKASTGGELTKFGSVDAIDSEPWYMAMTANLHSPRGLHLESLYEITFTGKDLIAFSVGTHGYLVHKTAAQGGQLPAGNRPYGIALSPDDKNAYVVDQGPGFGGTGALWIYNISPSGTIKPHSPASIPLGTTP